MIVNWGFPFFNLQSPIFNFLGDQGRDVPPASPGSGLADFVQDREGAVELRVLRVEVGREADADAGAVVDDDVAGVQLAGDFESIVEVRGGRAAPPRRIA